MNFREYIKNNRVLYDGAFSTYYAEINGKCLVPEMANIKDRETVLKIHKEYVLFRCRRGMICVQKYRCSCAFFQMQEQRYFIAPLSFSFAALRAYIPSKSGSPADNTEKSRSWCGLRSRRTTAASGSFQYRRWPSEPQ